MESYLYIMCGIAPDEVKLIEYLLERSGALFETINRSPEGRIRVIREGSMNRLEILKEAGWDVDVAPRYDSTNTRSWS